MFRINRNRAPTNAETIMQVPNTHITAKQRDVLYKRAGAGEDVYAYGSLDTGAGIINLWDTDTRIPFFPIASQRWRLVDVTQSDYAPGATLWALTFHPVPPVMSETILVYIDRRAGEGIERYQSRAARVAQMVAHYINLYGDEPAKYHSCHF